MNVLRSDHLSRCSHVSHGFFGRQGGVSEGIYGTLNCGVGSGDVAERVQENRRRVALHLGSDSDVLRTVYQVHGANAVVVDRDGPVPGSVEADGMVTTDDQVVLGILIADCAPVLFADTFARVVGAAHAGWKGALTGVLGSVVDRMVELGARRERIVAAVGPCIQQASYEVGAEFVDRFLSQNATFARFFRSSTRANHSMFDLPLFVREQLAGCGVAQIDDLKMCTYQHPTEYFSFRRTTHEGGADYGRNIAAIRLVSL